MKNLIIALALTLSLVSGISTVNAAELTNNSATKTQANGAKIYIKIYEDGAIWVYVYEEDGTYVTKYIETQN